MLSKLQTTNSLQRAVISCFDGLLSCASPMRWLQSSRAVHMMPHLSLGCSIPSKMSEIYPFVELKCAARLSGQLVDQMLAPATA